MSVESPVQRNPRDINGNDLGNDGKSGPFEEIMPENDNRKLPIVVVPEPKRAVLQHDTTSIHKSERVSPVKDHEISREFPSYPQFHWPTPFYAGFPHQYPFLPYALHGFPMAAFSDRFPIPSYQDHINAYNANGTIISPFPFMAGISPYQLPLPVRPEKTIRRDNDKNEIETSVKSAFETVSKPEPMDLSPQPCGKSLQFDKKKSKEGEQAKYQCEDCQKSYSTFSGLSKHKQFHCTHDLNKEFTCKYCDKTYVSLGALKMHIRTHTLPCKCKICGKAFSRPWLLQGHIRTHTGEKPFSCVHCLRAFADRSNLRAHLQTHSDVKKYSCKGCNKTFSRMSLLLKHEDSCNLTDV